MIEVLFQQGYAYELLGVAYYVFFLLMGSKRSAGRFSFRSRVLTLVAAIGLVACVPLHYGSTQVGVVAMNIAALVALLSTAADAARSRKRRP